MAPKLRTLPLIFAAIVLLACSAPWESSQRDAATTTAESMAVSPVASPSDRPAPSPSATPPIPTATPSSSPSPTATSPAPAATPVATPTPTQVIAPQTVAQCCGLFRWIDADHLLVFDTPAQDQPGAWAVEVTSGTSQLVSPYFGNPSRSGLVAIPDPAAGHTAIRRIDGSVVSTIDNGGVLTWVSPDGSRVVWLEELGSRQISSLVQRSSRLWADSVDGSGATALLEFAATAVHWLPDNRHVLALARRPDGQAAGIWFVDTMTGTNGVVIHGSFLQSLRLAPDGSRMAYLVTFSGQRENDGVWIANTDGSAQIHLRGTGSFRWAGDAEHLWFLELAPAGGGNDTLVKIRIADDSVVGRVDLSGRVLNDQWEVSPDGAAVAYWNEADQIVVVEPLPG